ncbi:MAG: LysR family transcriptional regulator [Alphaproteobacteria bacterium]|nr:LysR family transcriptional regulator [Alphaproteobacteria bacterium]MDE2014042.1 LysR family transcriptional regulator [Alphaproteobacteria bacterium]MDE2071977.1 LysR family transcriptional regulator [Alphaproteobacteria bacterium]
MKDTLVEGAGCTRRIVIDKARTIDFMGEEGRVYATPELVRDIEMTCRDFLLEHCDAGEDSVGTRVELDHMAATLLGMWVEITISVAEVKGRAVSFAISARDAVDTVAKGVHNRFVVNVEQTKARLKAKAAKAAGAGA